MARTYRGVKLRYGLAQRIALTLLALSLSVTTQAEITVDGSLGSFRGSLAGPAFQIDANLGRQVGSNLFHSFGAFNINHPESATFTANGSLGPIANVLGRVTGGSASTIDGVLRSTIPNANLFFINPHGVAFGPHAQLDVPGSFHVSTADYLRLGDGVRFDAQPSANDALLTTAPPAAFGFLSEQPAGISVRGSAIELEEGETLSLVGGDFDFVGTGLDSQGQPTSFLRAPGGRINLASVASAGEVTLGETGLSIESFARFGKIAMAQGSTINVSGQDGGSVFIRGGQLVMDNSRVLSNTLGLGEGGNVAVKTDRLHLKGGARISTSTLGPGKGGNLHVEAEDIHLEEISGLSFNTTGTGHAGQLTVKAGRLQLEGGARIGSGTFGPGKGGNLLVEAEDIGMEGGFRFSSGLSVNSEVGASGDAGSMMVKAGRLQIKGGAQILAVTSGTGKGGNVRVEAADILLSGDGAELPTGITAAAFSRSTGAAGDVTVKAGKLAIHDGARISASTLGTGRGGGSIAITARDIELSDSGGIFARSLSSSDSAVSGNIFIQAQDSLRIFDRGVISVETTQANAGDILLNVGTLLHLRDNSAITTSVAGGQGDGGSITIDPTFVVLDGSRIVANARQGRGGNIRIVSDFFFASPDSIVSASSDLGIDGVVDIESPDTDVISSALELPESFLDAASLLSDRCSARTAKGSSSFVVSGRGGVPPGPETMLPVYAFDLSAKADGSADRPLGEADYGSLIPLTRNCAAH